MSINIWRHGAVPRSGPPAATSAAGLPYWFSEFLADRAVRKPSPHNRRTDRGPAGHRGQQGQLARGVRRLRRHPASDKTCMPGCLSWNPPGPVAFFSRDDNRFGRHLIPDDACPRRRCTPIDYDPSIGTERPAWCRTSRKLMSSGCSSGRCDWAVLTAVVRICCASVVRGRMLGLLAVGRAVQRGVWHLS